MNWLKNLRLMFLFVFVLVSVVLVVYPQFVRPSGVIVASVEEDSPCKDIITVGSTITEIMGIRIDDSNGFARVTKDLKGPLTMIIDNNPRSCSIPENSTLKVGVKNVKSSGMRLGVDIAGGTAYVFNPEENVSGTVLQRMLESLKLREKQYDLLNTKIGLENGLIRIIVGKDEENYVEVLTEHGVLEGRFVQSVESMGEKGNFVFNDKTYDVSIKNGKSVLINGSEHFVGQEFILDGVGFRVENISSNRTVLSLNVFGDLDLTLVKDPQRGGSRLIKQDVGYVFVVPVSLAYESGKNFAKATKGQEVTVDPRSGESFLKNPLIVSIDGKPIVELPVRGDEAGKEIKELVVWGYKTRLEDATTDMIRLESIVVTKRLPAKLILLKTEGYTPKFGEFYITLPLYTVLIVSVVSSVFFFVKYHKRGVMILPLILLILCEAAIILGVVSSQWFVLLFYFLGLGVTVLKGGVRSWAAWPTIFLLLLMVVGIVMSKWSLDLPSIMGLVVFLLFSAGQGMFVGSYAMAGREYKYSTRIIWLSTLVFTLISLLVFFSFRELRGFSMAVAVGLMVSATMTKPIYTEIVEKRFKLGGY